MQLSESDLFYIEQNPKNKTPQQLAKQFSLTVAGMKKIIATIEERKAKAEKRKKKEVPKQEEIQPVQAVVQAKSRPILDVDSAMGTIKTKGITRGKIMTPAASELSDKARELNEDSRQKDMSAFYYPARKAK